MVHLIINKIGRENMFRQGIKIIEDFVYIINYITSVTSLMGKE